MAIDGPIVVIDVTQIRSDAILIGTSSIHALPLPQFQASEIQQWSAQDLLSFDRKTEGAKNEKYIKFLKWLWDTCAGPVLQTLRMSSNLDTDHHPRVWWIGTGAVLPNQKQSKPAGSNPELKVFVKKEGASTSFPNTARTLSVHSRRPP